MSATHNGLTTCNTTPATTTNNNNYNNNNASFILCGLIANQSSQKLQQDMAKHTNNCRSNKGS